MIYSTKISRLMCGNLLGANGSQQVQKILFCLTLNKSFKITVLKMAHVGSLLLMFELDDDFNFITDIVHLSYFMHRDLTHMFFY